MNREKVTKVYREGVTWNVCTQVIVQTKEQQLRNQSEFVLEAHV